MCPIPVHKVWKKCIIFRYGRTKQKQDRKLPKHLSHFGLSYTKNNKIPKVKFSHICSINLELTTVRDVSTSMTSFSGRLKAERFRRVYGTDLAPMWQLFVNSLCKHKYSYLVTYIVEYLTKYKGVTIWRTMVLLLVSGADALCTTSDSLQTWSEPNTHRS